MAEIIEVHGLEEITRKLDRLGRRDLIEPALEAFGADLRAEVGEYPEMPAPEPGRSWWERGYGQRYINLQGHRSPGRQISETMGKRWYEQLRDDALIVGNLATYSPFVHGERQAGVHRRRGWKQLAATAEARLPELIRRIEAMIDKIIGA